MRTFLGDLPLDHTADRGSGPVDVLTLIRPEQVRLRKCNGKGRTGIAGLTGRVVDHEYYGHDAVVRIRPDVTEDDQILVARVMGAASYPAGASVGLSVEGPVMAWPVN
jgi:TOBE domain